MEEPCCPEMMVTLYLFNLSAQTFCKCAWCKCKKRNMHDLDEVKFVMGYKHTDVTGCTLSYKRIKYKGL